MGADVLNAEHDHGKRPGHSVRTVFRLPQILAPVQEPIIHVHHAMART